MNESQQFWSMAVGDYKIGVERLPSGDWLAWYGLKGHLDASGATLKSERFAGVEEALDFVGHPHDLAGIPHELRPR